MPKYLHALFRSYTPYFAFASTVQGGLLPVATLMPPRKMGWYLRQRFQLSGVHKHCKLRKHRIDQNDIGPRAGIGEKCKIREMHDGSERTRCRPYASSAPSDASPGTRTRTRSTGSLLIIVRQLFETLIMQSKASDTRNFLIKCGA